MSFPCSLRSLILVACAPLAACSPQFPTGDISQALTNRSASWISSSKPVSYMVYGGYGSPCSHPGAHFNFNASDNPTIYAALDGVVSSIQQCVISGSNDKFTIDLAVGMKGAVPVFLEYSFEPFGGKVCSAAGQPDDFFAQDIVVKVGQQISHGDQIALFQALGAGAHVHINLKADGAAICPEIFSAAMLNNPAQVGSLASPTCGATEPIAAGTLCQDLTPSEDPASLE